MYKLWILVISLSGLLNGAWGQFTPAEVKEPRVSSTLNGEAVLACDANGQVLSTCIFEKVGNASSSIFISASQDKDGAELSVPGYFYKGNGFPRGECGLRIRNVKESDNGQWNCKLITSSGLRSGVIELEILKKPEAPLFSEVFGSVSDGNTKDVTCLSYNGQPQPSFKWFIGDKEVPSSALLPKQNATNSDGRPVTFQKLVGYKFSHEDDRKQLRCQTVHDSLTKDDKNEISETINVIYAPRSSEPRVTVKAPEIGSQKVIGFNISANPKPNAIWTIGKVNVQAGYASPDQKYEAKPVVPIGDGSSNLYLAELVIKKVQESDLSTPFKVKSSNQIGTGDFEIRLSNDPELEGGLGAGGIVGLVLGIPVLIILIVLIVVYARAKGMLCFKDGGDSNSTAQIEGSPSDCGERGNENPVNEGEGYPPTQTPPISKLNGDDGTSSEKERMGGDGDSNKGGAEENKPTISARLSALYDNLMSKKKDKTAPMDEEAPKEKEKEKEAANTDEKKPDDVVYTELGFARGDTEGNAQPNMVVRCTDEKTEYAEIVSVAPPVQGGEEEKKKTPIGSNNPSPKK